MPDLETSTADDESQETDKPPHSNKTPIVSSPIMQATSLSPTSTKTSKDRSYSFSNGVKRMFSSSSPSPGRSNASTPQPQANIQAPPVVQKFIATNGDAPKPQQLPPKSGANTPSTGESPSASDSEWGPSPPSTRPPSRAVSVGRSDPKDNNILASSESTVRPPVANSAPPSRPASVKSMKSRSSDGEGKFTLKELLSSGPKLNRKTSQRSGGSSKKSDSDRSDTSNLLKKYGVCERVAIGKGATSVVRLAHKWDRSEEKLYAVKEFRKRRKNETEKEYVKKLTAEFCISSTLHHINIVETVDLVQDEQQRWCEVMEYCPGGDLYAAIKKGGMSPSEVECCFKQILTGVAYLHGQGVAHRDIKPENLFFDAKGHLKIGDYGASTVYRLPWEATVHMSTGLCGSEPYIAPEQFTQKTYDARLVEIWACGIVYYCLHFQELPWRVAQQSDPLYAAYASTCANSNSASTCPPTINNLSPRACRSLLRRMLDPDPKTRCVIDEAISHAWVQTIEVCTEVKNPTHVHVHAREVLQAHTLNSSRIPQ